MSSLRCTHRFNKRHKIVIAICTIAVLLLNIGPYTVFTAPEVEVEHGQCIELRKDPLCTQDGEFRAYEVSDDGTSITKIKGYSTCEQYNANPKMVDQYGVVAWFCWGIFFLLELLALVFFIFWEFGIAIKKIFEWLNTDYPEDDEDEKEEE
jgi:hypothetical protein